jgi:hypothetical protein
MKQFCAGTLIATCVVWTLFELRTPQLVEAQGPAAQQKPVELHVGRYQFFHRQTNEPTQNDCLLDTATGKLWSLRNVTGNTLRWGLLADAPK